MGYEQTSRIIKNHIKTHQAYQEYQEIKNIKNCLDIKLSNLNVSR